MRLLSFILTWAAIMLCGEFALATEKPQRVAKDLLVLYTFEKSTDDLLHDTSGVNPPLHLRIDKPQGLDWREGRLSVTSSLRITSSDPARKVTAAVKRSGELTIEAWLKPSDAAQTGPARIVSLSADTMRRSASFASSCALARVAPIKDSEAAKMRR